METKNNQAEIGIATLVYNEDGTVKHADFKPTMQFHVTKESVLDFSNAKGSEDAIKENAQLVFAAWFEKMNEIELADRDKYVVDSQVIECDKPEDKVKKCVIRFVFREL